MRSPDDLTRENVTRAARNMLPAYPIFFLGLGVNYLLTPTRVLRRTPAYSSTDKIIPLELWGPLFLLIGAGLALALWVFKRRRMYQVWLYIAAATCVLWAGALVYAFFHSDATLAGLLFWLMIGWACRASAESLEVKEV